MSTLQTPWKLRRMMQMGRLAESAADIAGQADVSAPPAPPRQGFDVLGGGTSTADADALRKKQEKQQKQVAELHDIVLEHKQDKLMRTADQMQGATGERGVSFESEAVRQQARRVGQERVRLGLQPPPPEEPLGKWGAFKRAASPTHMARELTAGVLESGSRVANVIADPTFNVHDELPESWASNAAAEMRQANKEEFGDQPTQGLGEGAAALAGTLLNPAEWLLFKGAGKALGMGAEAMRGAEALSPTARSALGFLHGATTGAAVMGARGGLDVFGQTGDPLDAAKAVIKGVGEGIAVGAIMHGISVAGGKALKFADTKVTAWREKKLTAVRDAMEAADHEAALDAAAEAALADAKSLDEFHRIAEMYAGYASKVRANAAEAAGRQQKRDLLKTLFGEQSEALKATVKARMEADAAAAAAGRATEGQRFVFRKERNKAFGAEKAKTIAQQREAGAARVAAMGEQSRRGASAFQGAGEAPPAPAPPEPAPAPEPSKPTWLEIKTRALAHKIKIEGTYDELRAAVEAADKAKAEAPVTTVTMPPPPAPAKPELTGDAKALADAESELVTLNDAAAKGQARLADGTSVSGRKFVVEGQVAKLRAKVGAEPPKPAPPAPAPPEPTPPAPAPPTAASPGSAAELLILQAKKPFNEFAEHFTISEESPGKWVVEHKDTRVKSETRFESRAAATKGLRNEYSKIRAGGVPQPHPAPPAPKLNYRDAKKRAAELNKAGAVVRGASIKVHGQSTEQINADITEAEAALGTTGAPGGAPPPAPRRVVPKGEAGQRSYDEARLRAGELNKRGAKINTKVKGGIKPILDQIAEAEAKLKAAGVDVPVWEAKPAKTTTKVPVVNRAKPGSLTDKLQRSAAGEQPPPEPLSTAVEKPDAAVGDVVNSKEFGKGKVLEVHTRRYKIELENGKTRFVDKATSEIVPKKPGRAKPKGGTALPGHGTPGARPGATINWLDESIGLAARSGKWTAEHVADAAKWLLFKTGASTTALKAMRALQGAFGSGVRKVFGKIWTEFRTRFPKTAGVVQTGYEKVSGIGGTRPNPDYAQSPSPLTQPTASALIAAARDMRKQPTPPPGGKKTFNATASEKQQALDYIVKLDKTGKVIPGSQHHGWSDNNLISAHAALKKVFNGTLPTYREIAYLGELFGDEFSNQLVKTIEHTFGMRTVNAVYQAWNTPRTILAGFADLSATLNQTGLAFVGHPVRGGKSVYRQARAWASEDYYQEQNTALKYRALAGEGREAGLHPRDLDSTVPGALEENYRASWLTSMPGVRHTLGVPIRMSNRAFNLRCNEEQAILFDTMLTNLKAQNLAPELYIKRRAEIAKFCNAMVGRYKFDIGEGNFSKLVHNFFFSPQLQMSRAYLTFKLPKELVQAMRGKGMAPGMTSKMMANSMSRQAARILVANAALTYALHLGAQKIGAWMGLKVDFETNPLSTNFMRLVVHHKNGTQTAFTMPGAPGQSVRFICQMLSGKAKDVYSGKIKPQSQGTTLMYYAKSKAHPMTTLTTEMLELAFTGKSKRFSGEPVTAGGVVKDLFMPMNFQTLMDGIREHQAAGTIMGLADTMGINSSSQKPKSQPKSIGQVRSPVPGMPSMPRRPSFRPR